VLTADQSIVEWAASSPLVDGVLFGAPDSGELVAPVCAVASVGGVIGHGKGLTRHAALCSALGEALEQYAARHVPRASLIFAPYREVLSQAFDPRWLCLYSQHQYQRAGFAFRPFDPERPILWTSGYWVDTGEPVLLPAAAIYLSSELEYEEALCQATSNGLAAGESLSDAASRATLELYERGEFLRAWLTRQPGALFKADRLDTDYADLLDRVQRCGAQPEIYLVASDPFVAVCVVRGDGRQWPGITLGLGAAWCGREAAQKAVLEHGQTGPYLARVWRNGERPVPSSSIDLRSLQDHALYYCDPVHSSEFDFLRATVAEPPSAAKDVRIAIADVTTPDLEDSPFRIVRALAHGLQPIHHGAGFERELTPRIREYLAGAPPNDAPIPVC
jgi:ribosomal protein S12 methylthiotransferase accessory factor